jgi:hypothetical protein
MLEKDKKNPTFFSPLKFYAPMRDVSFPSIMTFSSVVCEWLCVVPTTKTAVAVATKK